jgi:DNA processing protein
MHTNSNKNNSKNYTIIKKEDYKDFHLLSRLYEINQIPDELYLEGNVDLLNNKNTKVLCVIGSRKATKYGLECVNYLLAPLASNPNLIIISGLALGIDSAAHKAALENNIKTITFPGSGLEPSVLYPKTNLELYKKIIQHNGLAISEFAPDKKSEIYFFPARNRLMAAIADLVLVVEAEEKSGTQITARLALEYNKDVAIVPGSIFSIYSRGTLGLFKDGAHPVSSGEDILNLLDINTASSNTENKKIKSENITETSFQNSFQILTQCEKDILENLNAPMPQDDLLESLSDKYTLTEMLSAITNLESTKYIKDNFSEIIRLK